MTPSGDHRKKEEIMTAQIEDAELTIKLYADGRLVKTSDNTTLWARVIQYIVMDEQDQRP